MKGKVMHGKPDAGNLHLRLKLFTAVGAAAVAATATAATVSWTQANQDMSVGFFDASNWNTAPVGDGTDAWNQDNASQYDVTLTQDATFASISKPQNKKSGALNFNLGSHTLATTGNLSWQDGALSISNGTVSVDGYFLTGNTSGDYPSQATLTGPLEMSVRGSTSSASLFVSSNVTLRAGARLSLASGAKINGGGTLALEDGAYLYTAANILPQSPGAKVTVSDGSTLVATQIGHSGANSSTAVDGATLVVSNRMTFAASGASLTLDNGACLTCIGTGASGQDAWTLIGSEVTASNCSVRIMGGSSWDAGKGVFVGFKASGCSLDIDSASVTSQVAYVAAKQPKANSANEYSATLRMAGSNAFLRATTCFYLGTNSASILRFNIPKDGFADENGTARAPLSATRAEGSSVTSYAEGAEPGDSTLVVRGKEFANAHPETTITLIDCGNGGSTSANKTATTAFLNWLKDHALVEDLDDARQGTFAVDGYKLTWTAPQRSGTIIFVR